ncbi:hypothetical protein K492DRAFT_200610 [Lichtheimia hyalospora FSU 10163]|nr:hypothetical protein K492DRAFT_200610 [Lichtheimia hyalospora FSU 10163]
MTADMEIDQLLSEDMDTDPSSFTPSFLPMVQDTIRQRFRASQMQFDSRITSDAIATLFREDSTSQHNLEERIRCMMDYSWKVPDSELEQLLAIRKASHDQPSIYIRSWTLSAVSLQALIANLTLHSSSHPLLRIWIQYLHQNPEKDIHIRYIGSTIRSANDRFIEDSRNANTFFGRFITALQDVDTLAYGNAQLYEFFRMRINVNKGPNQRDMMEQITIAFFGLKNLMNSQIGGVSFTYDPGLDAYNEFQQYQLSFFAMMNKNMSVKPDQFNDQLTIWRKTIIEEGERLERQYSNNESRTSPTLIAMLHQQALPATVNGHVVLVLVGTEVSRQNFKTATPFFVNSRAGVVVKTFLSRQASWANGNKDFGLDCFQSTMFPFLDLFPWLDTVNTRKAALQQLYEHFSITRPLVVIGLGKYAASALFSNLLHHHGCGHRSEGFSYIRTVALPRICYFLDDQWLETSDTDDPPSENVYIAVGNLDPGYEHYGQRSVPLIALMDTTWTVTLLVSEIVLGVVLNDPSLSRYQIIQKAWPLIDPNSSSTDQRLSYLYSRVESLKEDYQRFYRDKIQQQPKSTRNVDHDVQSTAACARMVSYGFAQGTPLSDTRMKQLQRMWRMNLPVLHMHIPRDKKDKWFQWASLLKEGISFFASAVRHVGMSFHHPLWNCLGPFMPENTKADWLDDESNLTSACLAWGAAMKLHLPEDHFSSSNQKRRIAIRWETDDTVLYAYMRVNHMRIVTLSVTHPLLVRWKDGENDVDVSIRFKAKTQAQVDSRHQYRIEFEKNGIYLYKMDEDLHTFHFTMDDINADPAVRRLWRHEMREQGHVLDDVKEEEPMPIGLPAFTAVTKAHNCPKVVNPNDALWLLKDFIEQQLPQDLRYHLAPPDLGCLVTGYHSFQQSFRSFYNAIMSNIRTINGGWQRLQMTL